MCLHLSPRPSPFPPSPDNLLLFSPTECSAISTVPAAYPVQWFTTPGDVCRPRFPGPTWADAGGHAPSLHACHFHAAPSRGYPFATPRPAWGGKDVPVTVTTGIMRVISQRDTGQWGSAWTDGAEEKGKWGFLTIWLSIALISPFLDAVVHTDSGRAYDLFSYSVTANLITLCSNKTVF